MARSALVEVVGSLGTLALLVGLAYFLARLISLARQHLLWRVRRKLILSYIFVGLVPALLIITFCLVSGLMLFGSVSQYIVTTRVRTAVEQAQFLARTCAIELARLSSDAEVAAFLERKQAALATRYPGASLAMVPVGRSCPAAEAPRVASPLRPTRPTSAGPWAHLEPPRQVPAWVPCGGFAGLVAYDVPRAGDAGPQTQLAVRAAVFADGAAPRFAVVLDLPVNESTAARMRDETGIELRDISAADGAPAGGARRRPTGRACPRGVGAEPPAAAAVGGDARLRRTGRRANPGRRRCRSG